MRFTGCHRQAVNPCPSQGDVAGMAGHVGGQVGAVRRRSWPKCRVPQAHRDYARAADTKNATPWVAFAAWTDAGWPGSFGSVVVPVTRQHLGHIRRFPATGPGLDHANVLGQHDKQASHGERAMRARALFPDLRRRVH